jgi:hypothetical protein
MIYLISRLDDHLENGRPLLSTKTKVALAIVLVPAITIGAVWIAAEKVKTAGVTLAKKVGETATRSFYRITSPFRTEPLPE